MHFARAHGIALVLLTSLPILGACGSPPSSSESAAALLPPRCQTSEHVDEIRARTFGGSRADKADGERLYRPFVPGLTAQATSAHFALSWGDALSVPPAQSEADALLASLEFAYAEEVVARGFSIPDGSGAHLMNVLVGNSGIELPTIAFEGAYATRDSEGFPYIVVHPSLASRPPGQAAAILAHEFFHTTQFSTQAYLMWRPSERSHWYVEAAADWMADQLYPADFMTHVSVALYAIQPHRSLELFGATSEPVLGFHQYGASLLATYLTEVAAEPQIVFHSWTRPPIDERALVSLDGILDGAGDNLAERFADFAAHNAIWDYARGAAYRNAISAVASSYEADDARIVANVVGLSPDWISAPARTRPEGWAYNVVRFTPSSARDVAVGISGDLRGLSGSAAGWRARVVVERHAQPPRYYALELVNGAGDLTLPTLSADVKALYLVVASVPEHGQMAEQFDYRYRFFSPTGAVPPAEPGEGGAPLASPAPIADASGCSIESSPSLSSSSRGVLVLIMLGLGLAWACRARKSDPPFAA